ncbi:hypothetical protein V8D89_008734 [Ganoderma adspersum]
MLPIDFKTFATASMHRFDGRRIDKGAPLPDDLVSYLSEVWETLPESTKTHTQHTLPQSSLYDPSPSVSAWNPPTKLIAPGATAAPVATQHVSSSSPSTTPSPSTPFLSPSPFCSLQHIPHDLSHNLSTAAPSPSQLEPLNIGDNWPGVQYGASRKVEFLMENQPSRSLGGRHTATEQPARPHPYAPAGTSVTKPRLQGGQPQTTRMTRLRRTQTDVLLHSAQTTPSVASVRTTGGNVVRRSHTAPSLVASSHPSRTPQAARPLAYAGSATPSGRQPPLPAVLDRRFSAESVEGLPAAPNRARQPTPTPSMVQVQTPTPIPGSPRVYTPSAGYQVQTTPVHAAVPLPPSFDHHVPAQTASTTTTTVPVATIPQEFHVGTSRPLSPNSFMDFLRRIPTPSVPDLSDVDAFLDAILALQMPAPVVPEDNLPLPDAFRIWPPDHWSEYWLGSGHPTGWEDFVGFPAR